ncbi:hypothetical protein [Serratia quinivorans]|uniref:hypothetical protein n=1 Tax=Serratia quinivorans TaxID=137545 RepID=UPI003F9C3D5E
MSLDSATFPLVWMRQQAAGQPKDTLAEFAEFSTLLQREQPFVLLCDRRMDESDEQDRDERTQVALWKRDHREALARWVKGMVLIEPGDACNAPGTAIRCEYLIPIRQMPSPTTAL